MCSDFTFVLICISLVTGDVEYCFICLFDICISSLVTYLLRSLVSLTCSLAFEFKEFFYSLDDLPFIRCATANIFSHSVACLLILLTLSFTEHMFSILTMSRSSIIFMGHVYGDISSRPSPSSMSSRFSHIIAPKNFIV